MHIHISGGAEVTGIMLNNYKFSLRLFVLSFSLLLMVGIAGEVIAADGDSGSM